MKTLKESILSRSSHSGEGFKAQRRELIEKWLKEYDIQNYTIKDDFTIDVDGSVYLNNRNLEEFPEYIQFGVVKGFFDCSFNKLTSLEGAPEKVGEAFSCNHNRLTSLKGAPKIVKSFYCSDNNLTSLEGAPEKVERYFYCDRNSLITLEGSPKEVGVDFVCNFNDLTSLKGAPETVKGNFICNRNKLTSLEGSPKVVGEEFDCRWNSIHITRKNVQTICKVEKKIRV